jgi:hypothetical protein
VGARQHHANIIIVIVIVVITHTTTIIITIITIVFVVLKPTTTVTVIMVTRKVITTVTGALSAYRRGTLGGNPRGSSGRPLGRLGLTMTDDNRLSVRSKLVILVTQVASGQVIETICR